MDCHACTDSNRWEYWGVEVAAVGSELKGTTEFPEEAQAEDPPEWDIERWLKDTPNAVDGLFADAPSIAQHASSQRQPP
jgi:hypothetical protein